MIGCWRAMRVGPRGSKTGSAAGNRLACCQPQCGETPRAQWRWGAARCASAPGVSTRKCLRRPRRSAAGHIAGSVRKDQDISQQQPQMHPLCVALRCIAACKCDDQPMQSQCDPPALILSPTKSLGFSTKRCTWPYSSITTTPYLLQSSTCRVEVGQETRLSLSP